jgi:EAL domain-containing protein (putative c-di-GMP-specific phosphodiesterase class I)
MPYLDRWVIQQVLKSVASQQNSGRDKESMFFINLAPATMGDPEFVGFLKDALDELDLPGSMLCFEIAESDLAERSHSAVAFISQVRQCGCAVALSGFGKNAALFDQIRGFQVEFLKIDGGTILSILGDPESMNKVASIGRVAKKIGVKTVAEMVESDEIVAKLGVIGIDFAQGFGISRPRQLIE